jgi:Zn-dependent protease
LIFRSLHLGRFFGIDIFLHWSMWALPVFTAVRGFNLFATDEAVLQVALVFGVYSVAVFHDLISLAAARSVGLRIRDFKLYPIGGVARLAEVGERPLKEVRVALIGPLAYVLGAVAIGIAFLASGSPLAPRFQSAQPYLETFFNRLFWLNVLLATLHLLPAFPMEGGRLFRGALALSAGRLRATEVAALLSSFIALPFIAAGMVWFGDFWWMILLGIIIHVSGQQELASVRYFASLQMAEPPFATGAPILVPTEQALDDNSRPSDPNFTGVTWSPRTRLWVVWRNGEAVRANALVGE